MATNIPTFKVNISEGMIDADADADRLFAYCIEADRGPVMVPTFVASATEAQRLYGVDFRPHFYQNPTGLIICRVGFEDMKPGFIEYNGPAVTYEDPADTTSQKIVDDSADPVPFLQIAATSEGPVNHKVRIVKAGIGSGYNLTVDIVENVDKDGDEELDVLMSKQYQNLTLEEIVDRIKRTFGDFLDAQLTKAYTDNFVPVGTETESNKIVFEEDMLEVLTIPFDADAGLLTGGSNGKMLKKDRTPTTVDVDDATDGLGRTDSQSDSADAPNAEMTRIAAYEAAFEKTAEIDVLGVATISDSAAVQATMINHIIEMSDPEVYTYRFGITGYLDRAKSDVLTTLSKIRRAAELINNEYIIFIGQGVKFQPENEKERILYPHEATQLFTGIRSALGYSEAIFGGEQKKVLRGVTDTLDLTNDGAKITKTDIVSLNEAGVCTFRKEYGEVTFTEGVTTVQDNDVMSYENLMSIIVYVTKRLIRIAKPYQGQRLTEDLKSTLQTALSAELRTITESDGTLMSLDEFNIPPYDVQVYSAGKTKFNDRHELVRESKIIIQCRIVPVGALRDIDLQVIAI